LERVVSQPYYADTIRDEFDSLDTFLRRWSASGRKDAVIRELEERGVIFNELADTVGKDFSPFDLVCHVG
jgi:type I restriction enzyme R subunit